MINPIIRQLQLDIITGDNNAMVDWFNELWGKIIIVETDVYHKDGGEIIYYYVRLDGSKQWVFFRDDAKNKFICHYVNYWSPLTRRFNITCGVSVQESARILLEKFSNTIITTTDIAYTIRIWEDQVKVSLDKL